MDGNPLADKMRLLPIPKSKSHLCMSKWLSPREWCISSCPGLPCFILRLPVVLDHSTIVHTHTRTHYPFGKVQTRLSQGRSQPFFLAVNTTLRFRRSVQIQTLTHQLSPSDPPLLSAISPFSSLLRPLLPPHSTVQCRAPLR